MGEYVGEGGRWLKRAVGETEPTKNPQKEEKEEEIMSPSLHPGVIAILHAIALRYALRYSSRCVADRRCPILERRRGHNTGLKRTNSTDQQGYYHTPWGCGSGMAPGDRMREEWGK